MNPELMYKIILAIFVIVMLIILQYLFNPRLNFTRKYSLEMDEEYEEKEELSEEEKKFYEQIWNAKKSKR